MRTPGGCRVRRTYREWPTRPVGDHLPDRWQMARHSRSLV